MKRCADLSILNLRIQNEGFCEGQTLLEAMSLHVWLQTIKFNVAGRGGGIGGPGVAEHGRDAPGAGRGRGFNHFGRGRPIGKGKMLSWHKSLHIRI